MRAITITVASLVLLLATSSQAKYPFDSVDDLTDGRKVITVHQQSKFNSFYKSKMPWKSIKPDTKKIVGQFLYHGANDLWWVTKDGATEVHNTGLGSTHYWWEDDGGRRWVMNVPWDNNHKTVKGVILGKCDKPVAKFTVSTIKVKSAEHQGRWTGKIAFPGGAVIDVGMLNAGVGRNIGNYVAYPSRIKFLSGPDQNAELLFGKGFQHGPVYAQFFYWDEHHNNVWFVTLNGDFYYDGTVFQGFSTAFPILGPGNHSMGKFYLTRPEQFQTP